MSYFIKITEPDIDGSALIDDKTKTLLHFSEKITRESFKIHEKTIQELRAITIFSSYCFQTTFFVCRGLKNDARPVDFQVSAHDLPAGICSSLLTTSNS